MKAEIKLIVSQDELSDYCLSYCEDNEELPTTKGVRQFFAERFVADHSDYIECDRIKLAILFGNGKEVEL